MRDVRNKVEPQTPVAKASDVACRSSCTDVASVSLLVRSARAAVEHVLVRTRATQKVAVIIPIYRSRLTPDERVSLTQCWRVLGSYPVVIIAPAGLELDPATVGSAKVERFAAECFRNLESYSRLLLRAEFYERFADYEYVLIYQLDAFVFRDELAAWCGLGYDYIGAPWFDDLFVQYLNSSTSRLRRIRAAVGLASNRRVGNGGLSLRRVPAALAVLRLLSRSAARGGYEDVFWSLYVTSYLPWFRVPDWRTALAFSFEQLPSRAFTLNRGRLPFGCHAWQIHEPDFWWSKIEKFGYVRPAGFEHVP